MKIGKSIKKLRLNACLDQKDFASRIGITQGYLSQIENGKKNPSMELLQTISDSLFAPLPIMFWFSIEESDISKDKIEIYKQLKASIDMLITNLI